MGMECSFFMRKYKNMDIKSTLKNFKTKHKVETILKSGKNTKVTSTKYLYEHDFKNGIIAVIITNKAQTKIEDWFFTKKDWFDSKWNKVTSKVPKTKGKVKTPVFKLYPIKACIWYVNETYDKKSKEVFHTPQQDLTIFNKFDLLMNNINSEPTYSSTKYVLTPYSFNEKLKYIETDLNTKINKSDKFNRWLTKHTNQKFHMDCRQTIINWQKKAEYKELCSNDFNYPNFLKVSHLSPYTQNNYHKIKEYDPPVLERKILQMEILHLKNINKSK